MASLPHAFLPGLLASSLLLVGPTGAQTFLHETVVSSTADGANCVIPADLDGDGAIDLVTAEYSAARVAWYRQLAPGSFGPAQAIGTGLAGAWQVRAADLDGDGDLDVVSTAATGDQVHWFENTGGGTSWTPHLLAAVDYPSILALEDVEGDGDVDVLTTSNPNDQLLLFENLGGGAFTPPIVLTTAVPGAYAVGTADTDADGQPDLLVGSYVDHSLWTLRNLGAGGFAAPVAFATGVQGVASVLGADLDGDGDQDVLCTASIDGTVSWFANDGLGNLGPRQDIGVVAFANWAEAADVDEDGDADVFVAGKALNLIVWYENLGSGTFGPQQVLNTEALDASHLSLADLDGDDDLDLAAASFTDDTIGIYQNVLPLPPKKPQLQDVVGLHCLASGSALVTGLNLLGATATVDGQAVPVLGSSATRLTLGLGPDLPGGLRTVTLTNGFGTTQWPDSLPRHPALSGPASVALGQPAQLVLDNGEPGAFVLAVSGALFAAPTSFGSLGWYHGLELNGIWVVQSGAFLAGATERTIDLPGVSDPLLVGVPFHFQAWTSQATSGLAGFTGVATVVLQ